MMETIDLKRDETGRFTVGNSGFWKGKKRPISFRRRMSEAMSGENHPFYGKPRPEETRRRISEAKKGKRASQESRRKMSEAQRGENHPLYGKHHSGETRKRMSEASRGRKHSDESRRKISESHKGLRPSEESRRKHSESIRGGNHWRWKGGKIPYYGPDWQYQRGLVRERDNYTCICGAKENGREHDVHHVVPYRISRDNSRDNLWTLCPKCHRKIEISMEVQYANE